MFNNLTPVVKNLLLANIGIFILVSMIFGEGHNPFALYYFESDFFKPWQFITYMFLHAHFMHLLGNMFGLFFFGPMLERVFGSQRFLLFYFICGVGAAFIYMGFVWYEIGGMRDAAEAFLISPDPTEFQLFIQEYYRTTPQMWDLIDNFRENPENITLIAETKSWVKQIYNSRINIPMVGASGAIFGILMGFGLLFPNSEMFLLLIPFPIKAKYMVFFYGLYTIYAGIQRTPGDNVAHFAHLGGMIFAFILIRYWGYRRFN